MARSIEAIDTITAELETRVNILDGMHLPEPAQAVVTRLQKDIASLRNTIEQVAVGAESDRQGLVSRIEKLENLVRTHFGVVL